MTAPLRIWISQRRGRQNIIQWCKDMFGEPQASPTVIVTVTVDNVDIDVAAQKAATMDLIKWPTKIKTGWAYRYGYFYFAEEEDATLFILKWNGKIVADKLGVATFG